MQKLLIVASAWGYSNYGRMASPILIVRICMPEIFFYKIFILMGQNAEAFMRSEHQQTLSKFKPGLPISFSVLMHYTDVSLHISQSRPAETGMAKCSVSVLFLVFLNNYK